jgi:hypothetical protein
MPRRSVDRAGVRLVRDYCADALALAENAADQAGAGEALMPLLVRLDRRLGSVRGVLRDMVCDET